MAGQKVGWLAVSVGMLAGCMALPRLALADTMRISASLYPPHTRITQISPLTNAQMDCAWGFACHNGQAMTDAQLFHLRTQDDLHRLNGWAQFGDGKVRGNRMMFAVFASHYDSASDEGMPWNVVAFADFRGALMSQQYQDLARPRGLLPSGQVGNTSAQLGRSPNSDVLAMSCWVGSIEVEGVVIYAHGSHAAATFASRELSRQIAAAVKGV